MTLQTDTDATRLARYIDTQITERPIEADIVRRVVAALAAEGSPVVTVYDGGEYVPVVTERDILEQVFNLDDAHLVTAGGSRVFLAMGEEWDLICDYSVNLEDALEPVFEHIDRNQR